jgi:uncharacterized membrane protein YgcG
MIFFNTTTRSSTGTYDGTVKISGQGILSLADIRIVFSNSPNNGRLIKQLDIGGDFTGMEAWGDFYTQRLSRDIIKVTTIAFSPRSPITVLPDSCFLYSDVKNIFWPEKMRTIPDLCCFGCENMEILLLPASLTTLGNRSFSNCERLEQIHIPSSVTNIKERAFDACLYIKAMSMNRSMWNLVYPFLVPSGVRYIYFHTESKVFINQTKQGDLNEDLSGKGNNTYFFGMSSGGSGGAPVGGGGGTPVGGGGGAPVGGGGTVGSVGSDDDGITTWINKNKNWVIAIASIFGFLIFLVIVTRS